MLGLFSKRADRADQSRLEMRPSVVGDLKKLIKVSFKGQISKVLKLLLSLMNFIPTLEPGSHGHGGQKVDV